MILGNKIWKFKRVETQLIAEPGPGFDSAIEEAAKVLSEKLFLAEEVAIFQASTTEALLRIRDSIKKELLRRGYEK